jgi:hypothetical protein
MQAPEALRQPFTDPDWLYEMKFDGYRCMRARTEEASADSAAAGHRGHGTRADAHEERQRLHHLVP